MTGPRLLLLAFWITSCLAAGPALAGEEIVIHLSGAISEDGIPGLDPDATSSCNEGGLCVGGTRNGQGCSRHRDCPDVADNKLVFDAGVVHVIASSYSITGPYDPGTNSFLPFELTIEPGAIVKVAATCDLDPDGIVSCLPTTFGGGQVYASDASVLKIDGAIITDIRDDSVGGDTNNDGSATTPMPSYLLRFGGTPDEYLFDSTIKYATLVGHFGSIPVEDNTFVECGGVGNYQGPSIYKTGPPVRGSVPSIVNNSFEFVAGSPGGPGSLDLRGSSPIIWGNTFDADGTAVVIGPMWENTSNYSNALPEDGVSIVAHNDIQAKHGILIDAPGGNADNILEQVRFRADIHDNHLVGLGGLDGVGLDLQMFVDATVRFNIVENYPVPFRLRSGGVTYPATAATAALIGLHLHNNSFPFTGTQTGPTQPFDTFWKDFGTMVDARNNWWGHPSGPKDLSNADALENPLGLGLPVSDGIDYALPLAKEPTQPLDSIQLRAQATPPPPLTNEFGDIVISVTALDYTLASSATGTVTIYVRDSQGDILLPPVSKPVTSGNHSVQFDALSLPEVPKFSNAVSVEAVLVPTGSVGEEVRSKPKIFPTLQTVGESFSLGCVDNPAVGGNCDPVTLLPDTTSNLALRFEYKTSGTLHGHFRLEVRDAVTREVIPLPFPTVNFTAPPASFGSTTLQFTSYTPVLLDVNDHPRFLYVYYWAENDGGGEIDSHRRRLDIAYSANRVNTDVKAVDPSLVRRNEFPWGYLLVGEIPRVELDLSYVIATKEVTNWRVEVTRMDARNAAGSVLQSYDPDPFVLLSNLATGTGKLNDWLITFEEEPVLPPGTVSLDFDVRLFAPNQGFVVDFEAITIPVRDGAEVVKKSIPSGVSNTTFSPIPASMNVTANTQAGDVTIVEYLYKIAPPVYSLPPFLTASGSTRGAVETRLIPLNRHYSIDDTFPNSGLTATITFTYDPEEDFPDDSGFDEDNLVVAVLNPLSRELESLPSTHNENQHTVTAAYNGFFNQWTVASETTAPAAGCADPTADGKTTAADALFALRASVGSRECALCICDANNSGKVTAADALLILKIAVGQLPVPDCLACG